MAAPVHVADDNATTAGRPPGGAIDGQIDRAAGATKARAMPYRRVIMKMGATAVGLVRA